MYKKFLLVLSTLLLTYSVILGQSRTVMVDTTGTLKYPSATTFTEKNNLVSLLIDTSFNILSNGVLTGAHVYDIEVKVLDENNVLLYHYSTVKAHQNHDVEDYDAVIAVTYSGVEINYEAGGCAKSKIILSDVDYLRSTLDSHVPAFNGGTSIITSVQVFPSEQLIPLFLNPKNTVLILRWGASAPDRDNNGYKAWKQVPILYIPKPSTSN